MSESKSGSKQLSPEAIAIAYQEAGRGSSTDDQVTKDLRMILAHVLDDRAERLARFDELLVSSRGVVERRLQEREKLQREFDAMARATAEQLAAKDELLDRVSKTLDRVDTELEHRTEATVVGRALLALQTQLERIRTVRCPSRPFDWTAAGMILEVRSELLELEKEEPGSWRAQAEALDVFCVSMNQLKTHDVPLFQGLVAAEEKLRLRCDAVGRGETWSGAKAVVGETAVDVPLPKNIVWIHAPAGVTWDACRSTAGWTAWCEALKLNAWGDTYSELNEVIGETLDMWFRSHVDHGTLDSILSALGWKIHGIHGTIPTDAYERTQMSLEMPYKIWPTTFGAPNKDVR